MNDKNVMPACYTMIFVIGFALLLFADFPIGEYHDTCCGHERVQPMTSLNLIMGPESCNTIIYEQRITPSIARFILEIISVINMVFGIVGLVTLSLKKEVQE